MADFEITSPDGKRFRVSAPDGATPDQVLAYAQEQFKGQKQPATLGQQVQSSALMRGVQGMRDPIDAGAQILARAVPDSVTKVLDYIPSKLRNSDSPFLATIGDRFFADPSPKAVDQSIRENEKQYQAARTATGQEGMDVSRFVGNVVSPTNAVMASKLPAAAASTPKLIAAGAGLGAAGGALTPVTGEGDFGPQKAAQMGLGAIAGAVLTPALAKTTEAVAPKIAAYFERNFRPEELGAKASLKTDEAIRAAFAEIGADMDAVPKAYLAQLRQQVLESLKQGKLPDVAAQVRQADFDALGMKSLTGQITRDATQFARERNLRAMPNMGEPIMSRIEQQNKRLQELVGGYGGPKASENTQAAQKLIQALEGYDATRKGAVDSAYKMARDHLGRAAPMNPADFSTRANLALDENMLQAFLTPEARSILNGVSKGEIPFNVQTAVQLDQVLSAAQRSAGKGSPQALAIGKVRDALNTSQIADNVGVDAKAAFDTARGLAKARFDTHEAVPALKAVANGEANADNFIQKFVINDETKNVKALSKALSPEAFEEARNQMGAYIQRAAFGENVAGDKILAPERLAKALRSIGTEKLGVFYSPQEIQQLQTISRVGAYINQVPSAAPVMGNPNMTWAGSLLGRVPGAPAALQLATAFGKAAKAGSDVNASLAAKIPVKSAELDPQTVRKIAQALALSGAIGGSAAAPR